MTSLIHADIFFFITGIAVILFASACAVLVLYLILIARDVRYVVKIVKDQAEALRGDAERIRIAIQNKQWNILELWRMFKKNPFARSAKRKVGATKE